MAFYHVSIAGARESIQRHGLDPSKAMESPWSNCDDYDEGIYLLDSITWADWYRVLITVEGEEIEPDIWRVDVEGLTLVRDASITPGSPMAEINWGGDDFFADHAFYSADPIPAERLTLVVNTLDEPA